MKRKSNPIGKWIIIYYNRIINLIIIINKLIKNKYNNIIIV